MNDTMGCNSENSISLLFEYSNVSYIKMCLGGGHNVQSFYRYIFNVGRNFGQELEDCTFVYS